MSLPLIIEHSPLTAANNMKFNKQELVFSSWIISDYSSSRVSCFALLCFVILFHSVGGLCEITPCWPVRIFGWTVFLFFPPKANLKQCTTVYLFNLFVLLIIICLQLVGSTKNCSHNNDIFSPNKADLVNILLRTVADLHIQQTQSNISIHMNWFQVGW